MKPTKKVIEGISNEIGNLIYENPKCDFEHIWNTAMDKALECFNGYDKRRTKLDINKEWRS